MEGKFQELKIAWLLEDFSNPYQEYVKNLFVNLKKLYELDITVITLKKPKNKLTGEHAVRVITMNFFFDEIIKRLTASNLNRVENALKDFDLVHVQQSFLYPVISRLASSASAPNLVITFRGGDSYIKPWVNSKWRNYQYEIRDSFKGVQVMSNNQKNYLLKWGHDLHKIYTIPISTSTRESFFVPNRIESCLKICSIFRMTWEKNIEANLRLLKELVDRKLEVVYNVYGDGIDLGQLYYLVDRFELTQYVKIHGRVSPEILVQEIKNSHLLFQLSGSEALPASVIEALSFGIPCIVSDVGGFPEIIQSGVNGYLMNFNNYKVNDAADFVEQLVNDDNLYQKLKRGAFEKFESEFSPSIEAEKVYNMYSSIMKTYNVSTKQRANTV